MKIEKLNYSRHPWRLVDSKGCEVYVNQPFTHPEIGHTVIQGAICGATKAECTDAALALLEALMKRPKA